MQPTAVFNDASAVRIMQPGMHIMQYAHSGFSYDWENSNLRMAMMTQITYRNAGNSDADRCYEIEISAYESDEAATLEKIKTRIIEGLNGINQSVGSAAKEQTSVVDTLNLYVNEINNLNNEMVI